MRWLIAEDSLLNRKGHWFEYLGAFHRELRGLGDEVVVLGSRGAEPFLQERLQARPVLPDAIFHRMGDGAGALKRYGRVPLHAWRTWRTMSRWLPGNGEFDVIFVPTVIVHHLLGWRWVLGGALRRNPRTRLVLFFPGAPIHLDGAGTPQWDSAPTAKLFRHLVRSMAGEAREGRVVFAAETQPMVRALGSLTGVPFTYLPHPVALADDPARSERPAPTGDIVLGSYGGARHEKGTDLLIAAVERHLADRPATRLRFVLQMADSFTDAWKRLQWHPRVEIVEGYFPPGEYPAKLARTHGLLLPYRASSYALRVSRVVIEAMVGGFPAVATARTTLADQLAEFGAGVFCEDEDVAGLAAAIGHFEDRFADLHATARDRRDLARRHFSVRNFRELLLARR